MAAIKGNNAPDGYYWVKNPLAKQMSLLKKHGEKWSVDGWPVSPKLLEGAIVHPVLPPDIVDNK